MPLYAVVHETLGVKEFAPFLEADGIFLDKEVGQLLHCGQNSGSSGVAHVFLGFKYFGWSAMTP